MNQAKIKWPKPVIAVFVIICLLIAFLIGKHFYEKTTIPGLITSPEQLTRVINASASNYKTEIHFTTTMNPDLINYDQIFHDIMADNTYIGCELYSFSYRYTYDPNGNYSVTLKLRDPALHRVILTKIRVKQIASHLRDLDDYDKVKAVHDYLVLSNEYSYTVSSAFNALYVGKSACNGYAYSFYAIMEELGVPVTCEYGGSHAWNTVCIDDEWYNIDVTWDDPGGKNVSYDFFLKCNRDFTGHEHANATAERSHPIVGRGAVENYNMIPKYKLIMILSCLGIFFLFYFVLKLKEKRRKDREFREFYGN